MMGSPYTITFIDYSEVMEVDFPGLLFCYRKDSGD